VLEGANNYAHQHSNFDVSAQIVLTLCVHPSFLPHAHTSAVVIALPIAGLWIRPLHERCLSMDRMGWELLGYSCTGTDRFESSVRMVGQSCEGMGARRGAAEAWRGGTMWLPKPRRLLRLLKRLGSLEDDAAAGVGDQ
jgi:hypothetical protein